MNGQQKLEKILEISRMMMATVDLDNLLRVVINSALQLLDAERASILLYDVQKNELTSHIAVGEKGLRFSADCGIAGATIATRTVINVPDAYLDDRFNPAVDQKTGFVTRTILSLPLIDFANELVGVLQILNKRSGVFDADDEQLAATLAAQAGVSLQRARLMTHYREKLEMERAMEIAREIQQRLLPRANATIAGFDVAGVNEPADDTGGDMFDFIPLADGRWLVVVADATGHGVGPALIAAEARAMLRATAVSCCDPSHLLSVANRLLANDLDGRFVTCFIALVDPVAQAMTYASAGHGPLIFYRRATDHFDQAAATGPPLGVLAGADYTDVVAYRFAPGDFALIVTDGFFEATAADGSMYGTERLIARARRDRDAAAAQMLHQLQTSVREFLQTEIAQDDLTGVVIKRL